MSHPKILKTALSFDDVLLVPAKSEVIPSKAELKTYLTPSIQMNIPITSAAMDTVTEAAMAIALAQEGGIGIIHKNMSVDKQATEVDKVKRSESGMITDPITLSPDNLIQEALTLMANFRISGIPITSEGKLVGILTNRDLRFETRMNLKIKDVMTKQPLVTAPMGTTLEDAKNILQKHKIEKLPVVDENDVLMGLITVKDINKKQYFPGACKDEIGRLRVGAAVGTGPQEMERVKALVGSGVDVVVVDTAHGHSVGVVKMVERIKENYNGLQVIGGNIATAEATEDLIKAGADAVKVGMGPGSICTTRVISGCGVPQITAVLDCSEVADKYNVPVIADGGIRYSGDITKALGAGASCVMIGSIFAGTDEAPGDTIIYKGRSYKVYRGMGSIGAMREGSKDRYFQEEDEPGKLVPEGIEGKVPYKGSLSATLMQLIGGLRAGMGYCGCRTIKELNEKTNFYQMTAQGQHESHVHDVIVTKEAPNYRLSD